MAWRPGFRQPSAELRGPSVLPRRGHQFSRAHPPVVPATGGLAGPASSRQRKGMLHMTKPAGRKSGAAVPMSEPAIMELTRSGIVTGWSPGAALLYGYREEEIVGRGADVLRPADRQAEQEDVLRRVTAGGRSERYEADMVRKDGTVVRVSLTVAPIVGPAGDVAGVRAVSWEVSGQRAGQEEVTTTIDSERRDARHAQERTDAQRRDARDAHDL